MLNYDILLRSHESDRYIKICIVLIIISDVMAILVSASYCKYFDDDRRYTFFLDVFKCEIFQQMFLAGVVVACSVLFLIIHIKHLIMNVKTLATLENEIDQQVHVDLRDCIKHYQFIKMYISVC